MTNLEIHGRLKEKRAGSSGDNLRFHERNEDELPGRLQKAPGRMKEEIRPEIAFL
jgi:hypothetical protein